MCYTACRFVEAHITFWGFQARMVYLDYITCLRHTILVRNPLFPWFYKIYLLTLAYVRTLMNCCFKLGMMLDMTKLYSIIPVWVTLTFSKGHRVTEKLELVQALSCTVAWSNQNVHDVWLCKGDDLEEVCYGEYGSFVHLLFSLFWEIGFHIEQFVLWVIA